MIQRNSADPSTEAADQLQASATSPQEVMLLVGRAPALGPVVGWTRYVNGTLVARIWTMPDESRSDSPVMLVTARFDEDDNLVDGTAQFWKLASADPSVSPDSFGHASTLRREALRCGLADLTIGDPAWRYRAAFVHRLRATSQSITDYHERREPSSQDAHPPQDQLRGAAVRPFDPSPAVPRSHPSGAALHQPLEFEGEFIEQLTSGLDCSGNQQSPSTFFARMFFEHVRGQYSDAQKKLGAPNRVSLSRAPRRVRNPAACDVRLAKGAFCSPRAGGEVLRFAAMSCRYPGVSFDRDRANVPLEALYRRADLKRGPAFAFLLGDQIYADAFNGVLDVEDRREKFTGSYARAFGDPGYGASGPRAARLPLYCVPDDHEIKDNWPTGLAAVRPRRLTNRELRGIDPYPLAWWTYVVHQRIHAPPQPALHGGSLAPLWYQFDSGPLGFFVLDTRFERDLDRDHPGKTLMSRSQWRALRRFLWRRAKDQQNGKIPVGAPSFVVSGSVFAPGLTLGSGEAVNGRRVDTWQQFPRVRAALASRIARLELQNVVFLSGDYHCAAVASLSFRRCAKLRAYAIVAPALYAPMPFLNALPPEIAKSEKIAGRNGIPIATCEAQARDVYGVAEIIVCQTNGGTTADDWTIGVEIRAPNWSGCEERPPLRAELAHGCAKWLDLRQPACVEASLVTSRTVTNPS